MVATAVTKYNSSHVLKFSKQAGVTCWSFFADNMAPFTSAGASVVLSLLSLAEQADCTSQDPNGATLVQSFVDMLARAVKDMDTYQVNYIFIHS